MSFKKFVVLASSVLALTLSATAAQAADQTYVVGAGGTYRPFEFETPKKELVGFDIDIIKAIAKASGFQIKLVSTPWEGIFATLGPGPPRTPGSAGYLSGRSAATRPAARPS